MPFDPATGRWHPSENITDLAPAATLADVIAKVNAILAALRKSGEIGGAGQ